MTRRIDLKRIHTVHFGTMRAINRQIVLNYVRDRGPISRAEIAPRTSLQRSTISEIVDSLLAEGLIEEVGAGASTGGRCPQLLALRASADAHDRRLVRPRGHGARTRSLRDAPRLRADHPPRRLVRHALDRAESGEDRGRRREPARPRRPFYGAAHLRPLFQ